jgi:hypothetical protein
VSGAKVLPNKFAISLRCRLISSDNEFVCASLTEFPMLAARTSGYSSCLLFATFSMFELVMNELNLLRGVWFLVYSLCSGISWKK